MDIRKIGKNILKIEGSLKIQPFCGNLPSQKVLVELEASFLSQMLKSSGLFETPSRFSGGVGESQFSSFLRDEFAKKMAESGEIGLASSILKEVSVCHEK